MFFFWRVNDLEGIDIQFNLYNFFDLFSFDSFEKGNQYFGTSKPAMIELRISVTAVVSVDEDSVVIPELGVTCKNFKIP